MELETLPSDKDDPRENLQDYENLSKKSLFQRYVQSASIHGVPLSEGPQHYRFRRPLWRVLVTVMAAGLGCTHYGHVSSLLEYPIKTLTRATLRAELPFPAVTICNLNQYIRDRVPDNPIIEQVFLHQSQYVNMARQTGKYNKSLNLSDYTDISGEDLARIVQNAAPRLEDFLLQCTWSMHTYPCEDLFRPLHTGYGTCFVFNGPDIPPDQLHKAVSSLSALRVLIETQNNKSFYSKVIHAGVKVLVHQPDEKPFPQFQGWYVRPGVAADMAISRQESHGLPSPYKAYSNGYCEKGTATEGEQNESSESGYTHVQRDQYTSYRGRGDNAYTTEHCISDCLLERLEAKCGCRHYFSLGNRPYCSAKEILGCYMPGLSHLDTTDVVQCGCRRQCDTVSYTADTSYSNFASKFVEEQAVRDGLTFFDDHLRENIIDLNVFFKSLTVMEVVQEPEMTLTTLIGTVGGHMGLFLGASMLSVAELVELLVLLLLKTVRNWLIKPRSKEESESGELQG